MFRPIAILALGLGLSAGLHAELVLDRPEISIGFDDDASSLLITADFKDHGVAKRETFSLGKDMHLVFGQQGKDFVKLDEEFRSKSWEAYLLPDASGFILMERQYDGTSFENLGLTLYEYYPERRVRSLRLANGSPYWSQDGKQLALVEPDRGAYNIVIYDVARGNVILKKSGITEDALKVIVSDYVRARVCDDEKPCEMVSVGNLNKIKKKMKK